MPLVTPLNPDHDLETKELAEFFNETLGFCPNSVLTMQRRPAISKAFINLNKAVMANEGRVTSALKRLIAWVSSNATGCRYCQAHAIRAAERYGEGEAETGGGELFRPGCQLGSKYSRYLRSRPEFLQPGVLHDVAGNEALPRPGHEVLLSGLRGSRLPAIQL